MKNLLALCALITAVTTPAQIASNSTPDLGSVYSFAFTASGNSYSLTDIPVYEAYLFLPFGLDFRAGWGAVYGQKMSGTEFVGNVFGAQLYASKDLGGDGAFVRGSAFALVGDPRPDFGFAVSLGWRF